MTYKKQKSATGLELMREPFPAHQISKLPKPTKAQTDEVRANFKAGIRCEICGTWHHPKVVHLDYVGHAALTDRLLECDPAWNWEPLAMDDHGLPVLDRDGGLWIKLTVCGVTRLGYGDAQGKQGGDAMKERIGDALRNAAMRFGAALDLWHKGDLHAEEEAKQSAMEVKESNFYSDEDFQKNFPNWEKSILSGKRTAAQLIKHGEAQGIVFSELQKTAIENIGAGQHDNS